MSKRDKLRQKLRNNPKDATMQEVETLLGYFGFVRVRIKGSHYIFEYETESDFRQTVVPLHGRKVKKIYVKRVVNLIDELFPEISVSDETIEEESNND
jgi:predicted RNA binding protein YcfA (HicA-like mRNA interferase family)